jgi:GNAT superfamily N-acetyltransferase
MTTTASRAVTRIASVKPADRAAVDHILRGTGRFRETEIGVALELFDAAFGLNDVLRDPDYHWLGAYDDRNALLGFVTYGPTPSADGTWDLYWIAVSAEAHGRGIGSRLLGEVERQVSALGARLLMIETSSRDGYEATHAFYAARGYGEQARTRDFYEPGDDRILLTKLLEAET